MKSEIILLLVSGVLLAVGSYLWQKGSYLLHHGKKAEAIVFDNKTEYSKDATYYFPIVRFKTEENKDVAHELSIGYTSPMLKGTVIKILYDPDDPATVQIDSRSMLELVPRVLVISALCGLVLVLFEVFELTHLMD
jgi:hypothetical protein